MANIRIFVKNFDNYLDYLAYNTQQEEIIITRHTTCITLGKNSNMNEVLRAENLQIYQSDRAGGATYHDMGQLVLYPHINLRGRNIGITDYINLLQIWAINALQECDVVAKTGIQPGLWVYDDSSFKKIAFLALAVRNGWVKHGIAFNLQDTAIKNFSKIIACRSFEVIGLVEIHFEQLLAALIKHSPF